MNTAVKVFKEHEFVEGIIPLHEEHTARQCATKVLVPVVRVPAHTALGATLSVGHLGKVEFSSCRSLRVELTLVVMPNFLGTSLLTLVVILNFLGTSFSGILVMAFIERVNL